MNYLEFVNKVKDRARIATLDEAEQASCSILNVLAQLITRDKAALFAERIPAELSECLKQEPNSERFDALEFCRRVGERAGVDTFVVPQYSRAVGSALEQAVGRSEFEETISDLPPGYDGLFGLAPEQERRKAA